jgi:hypothetical protein
VRFNLDFGPLGEGDDFFLFANVVDVNDVRVLVLEFFYITSILANFVSGIMT